MRNEELDLTLLLGIARERVERHEKLPTPAARHCLRGANASAHELLVTQVSTYVERDHHPQIGPAISGAAAVPEANGAPGSTGHGRHYEAALPAPGRPCWTSYSDGDGLGDRLGGSPMVYVPESGLGVYN